jgi:GDP-4-dehydro-6-deoxy-D-mannose reductase
MKVVVTGAGGFVGGWLTPALAAAGHEVVATYLPDESPPAFTVSGSGGSLRWLAVDLRDPVSVEALVTDTPEAVVHLAAVASGAAARRDPGLAWEVNAACTARLAGALGAGRAAGAGDPLLLLASSAEVYGALPEPRLRLETDPPAPLSPYAASKLGAEISVLETARRTGLRVIIARAFPHTGPGQSTDYVVPAFAQRLRAAKRLGAPVVKTGNLEPVRDFLDVRDVVQAYLALLDRGEPGHIYNIASGEGRSLRTVFLALADLIGVRALPEADPHLTRSADLPHLVGDASQLRARTGWAPRIPFDRTLQDLVNAQAD